MNNRQLSSFIQHSAFSIQHSLILAEIVLVFAVFFIQGAQPVPDVNEPYYLGKAIHYWNPSWARGDFFLGTRDTHEVFYYTFGWLSLWLPPLVLAWFGRVLTWGLLAWAWRRLSFALLPKRWCSILTAALLVCLVERCNMAGEWVVGGVEAKGFAFVLLFLGLEALVRGRWNRTWLLLGAASAFHVLVGGWSVVAAGLAWLMLKHRRQKAEGRRQNAHPSPLAPPASPLIPSPQPRAPGPQPPPPLRSMWPAILGGLLLSLPGLIPALTLNWGADPQTLRLANQIYVYRRLAHHLDPAQIPVLSIVRFVLLGTLWLLLCFRLPAEAPWRGLRAFVAAAVIIALTGGAICCLSFYAEDFGAALLRFYWFRLADFAVPMGVALQGTSFAVGRLPSRPAVAKCSSSKFGGGEFGWPGSSASEPPEGRGAGGSSTNASRRCPSTPATRAPNLGLLKWATTIAILVAGVHLGAHLLRLPVATPPRAYLAYADRSPEERLDFYADWRDACTWIARPGNVPANARFLTPMMSHTFKWYADRAEVANWKEIPQDAVAIVEWWQRIEQVYVVGRRRPEDESLADLGAERLQELGPRYGADYVITLTQPRLDLPVLYENQTYIIYQLRKVAAPAEITDN